MLAARPSGASQSGQKMPKLRPWSSSSTQLDTFPPEANGLPLPLPLNPLAPPHKHLAVSCLVYMQLDYSNAQPDQLLPAAPLSARSLSSNCQLIGATSLATRQRWRRVANANQVAIFHHCFSLPWPPAVSMKELRRAHRHFAVGPPLRRPSEKGIWLGAHCGC